MNNYVTMHAEIWIYLKINTLGERWGSIAWRRAISSFFRTTYSWFDDGTWAASFPKDLAPLMVSLPPEWLQINNWIWDNKSNLWLATIYLKITKTLTQCLSGLNMTYYRWQRIIVHTIIYYKGEEYYQDEVAFKIFSASIISSGVVTCKAQDKLKLACQCIMFNFYA